MQQTLPLHGGNLQWAERQYGIPAAQWVDLSTGINPIAYPVDAIPASVFQMLPYRQADFTNAVTGYYHQPTFLAVVGTQAAIQALPALLNKEKTQPVLLPLVGYKEHEQHWLNAGNHCCYYNSLSLEQSINDINHQLSQNNQQHVVIINPNNPTGVLLSKNQLVKWANQLGEGAYLIVDEAFIDATPQHSLLLEADLPENIIVLRSFGKFFGLAGLRVGFVFAAQALLAKLNDQLGIWQINGPAQWLATQALTDNAWQVNAIQALAVNNVFTMNQFRPLLGNRVLDCTQDNLYFSSYKMPQYQALMISEALAQQGVLTRVVLLSGSGHQTQLSLKNTQPPSSTTQALLRVGTLNSADTESVEKVQRAIRQTGHLVNLAR